MTVYNIHGDISGDDNGVKIADVDDNVQIDNRFGGNISGHDENGVDIDDVGDEVTIRNSASGTIKGHDDGVHIRDVDDGVSIDNRFGEKIPGAA